MKLDFLPADIDRSALLPPLQVTDTLHRTTPNLNPTLTPASFRLPRHTLTLALHSLIVTPHTVTRHTLTPSPFKPSHPHPSRPHTLTLTAHTLALNPHTHTLTPSHPHSQAVFNKSGKALIDVHRRQSELKGLAARSVSPILHSPSQLTSRQPLTAGKLNLEPFHASSIRSFLTSHLR